MTTKERNILKAMKMLIQLKLDGKAYDIDTILEKYPVDKVDLLVNVYSALNALYKAAEDKDLEEQKKALEKTYAHHVLYGRKKHVQN